MKKVREELHSFRYSRTRAREIRIRVDSVHRRIDDVRQPIRSADCVRQTVAAGRDDEHLGIRCGDIIPRDAPGIRRELTQRVITTSGRNHLRHPVAGAKQRLGPFEESDRPTPGASDSLANTLHPLAYVIDQFLRSVISGSRAPDRHDVRLDLGDAARGEGENPRRIGEILQRPTKLVT
jgi:hypothetical protein